MKLHVVCINRNQKSFHLHNMKIYPISIDFTLFTLGVVFFSSGTIKTVFLRMAS